MSWFDPLPLDEYEAVNKKHGQNAPKEAPTDSNVPGPINVRCGPSIRLFGTHEKGHDYRATMMLVVEGSEIPPVTFEIGPSLPQQGEPQIQQGEFPYSVFHEEEGFTFVRYAIDSDLADHEQRVRYAVGGHSAPGFQFFVPAAQDSMNVMSYSCNGFSLGTPTSEFPSSLWLDVLRKHQDRHYHVMLGGGDQLYCDSIKVEAPGVKEWAEGSSYSQKRSEPVSPEFEKEMEQYYLNQYLGWFGKGFAKVKNGNTLSSAFPTALQTIPQVNVYDDHDIIDGFGSYKDSTMNGTVFNRIGNVAYKYYMLFQQHMSPQEVLSTKEEPSWIIGGEGPYIKQQNHSLYMQLGREIGLLGLDCRTERKLKQICSEGTYKAVFSRLEAEMKRRPETKHLLVMLGVPILYPRLVWLEKVLSSKALIPVRKLAQNNLINRGLVNEFDGGVEVLDDLNDHWCAKGHKRERNALMKRLLDFGANHGVRVTILSGDVHLAALGRIKSKLHDHPTMHLMSKDGEVAEKNMRVTDNPEKDPRLIFNVISSAIINAPPPDAMASLLNSRSKVHKFNHFTSEDCVPIFSTETTGESRSNHQFYNKRNWSDLVLAKQHPYAPNAREVDQEPIRKFPQPIIPGHEAEIEKQLANQKVDEHWCKYPLLPDSLVTSIWVEQDPKNFASPTTSYEVLIPPLHGQWKLDQSRIKHLG
ncbi:hypothetical protein DICA2_E08416 [Diutina catenulata]